MTFQGGAGLPRPTGYTSPTGGNPYPAVPQQPVLPGGRASQFLGAGGRSPTGGYTSPSPVAPRPLAPPRLPSTQPLTGLAGYTADQQLAQQYQPQQPQFPQGNTLPQGLVPGEPLPGNVGNLPPIIPSTYQAPPSTAPTYIPPPLPGLDYSKLDAATAAAQGNTQLSPEEIAAQEKLNALESSYKQGSLAAEMNSEITTMNVLTGQQRNLLEQYNIGAETLQQRLALAQAKRTSALEGSKYAIDAEKAKLTAQQGLNETNYKSQSDAMLAKYNRELADYNRKFEKPTVHTEGGVGYERQPDGTYKSVFGKPKEQTASEKYGTGSIGEFQFYQSLTPAQRAEYNAYQNADANRKRLAAGGGGLSNVQIDNGRAIATSYENSPIIKNFIEIQSKYLNAQMYTGRGDGATDIASIYDLMKVLDPTSVVRNEEYATGAAKSGNIFAGYMARFNGMIDPKGGFVSPQAKANIFQVISDRYNVAQSQYSNFKAQKQQQIDSVAPGYKLTDYAGDLGTQQGSGGGQTVTAPDGQQIIITD